MSVEISKIFMICRRASNKISSFEHVTLIMLLQATRISNYDYNSLEQLPRNLNLWFLTNPCSVQVDGYKGGRDGEVVDEGVKLQHEPELVGGGNEADEEVDHEEDVEGEVDLLEPVLAPGHTLLNSVVAGGM